MRNVFPVTAYPNNLYRITGRNLRLRSLRKTHKDFSLPPCQNSVERLVQSVKCGVKAGIRSGIPLECALQAFLLQYRTTLHTNTRMTPSTVMLGWDLLTHLDLLRPELQEREEKQAIQSRYHNRHSKGRELATGTAMWARNWREGPTWVRARIPDSLGPMLYLVEMENGDTLTCKVR